MKYIVILILAFTTAGCISTNSLNDEWKESIGQLQITPVMPLRENLSVGEVYRYLKKPKSYYSDGQVEPSVSFKLNIQAKSIQGKRVWPTFTYSGGSTSSLSVASEAVGILSANSTTSDTINITINDGYSMQVSQSDVIREFCDVNTVQDSNDPILTVKKAYHEQIRAIGTLNWNWWKQQFERKVVYLRIPTEVYFVNKINVTAHKTTDNDAEFKIPDENKLTKATGNISVAINSDKTVSLVESFPKPMTNGYRAILVQVRISNMRVVEFPEDAGKEFWSDL